MVEYLPVFIFALIALLFPVVGLVAARILARIFKTRKDELVKLAPYECGIKPESPAHERFSIRFYVIALLFVVFDVEAIFLFPWAVLYDRLLLFGLIEMGLFLGILVLGYFYAWKKRALEWV